MGAGGAGTSRAAQHGLQALRHPGRTAAGRPRPDNPRRRQRRARGTSRRRCRASRAVLRACARRVRARPADVRQRLAGLHPHRAVRHGGCGRAGAHRNTEPDRPRRDLQRHGAQGIPAPRHRAMCTAMLSVEPGLPVLLAGIRDELTDRAWQPPGWHWPEYPGLIGGRDLLAGGTWLAVAPRDKRVSCVLNGRGQLAPTRSRRSRGVLPLQSAAGQSPHREALPGYDPFHLLTAGPGRAIMHSWDGQRLAERELGPGLHFIVNSGLASDLASTGRAGPREPGTGEPGTGEPGTGQPCHADLPGAPGPPVAGAPTFTAPATAAEAANGREHELARIGHFLRRFEAAIRPEPEPGAPIAQAWGAWLPLLDGNGIGPYDRRALIVRRVLPDGRVWGTTSITLIALSDAAIRYDFTG